MKKITPLLLILQIVLVSCKHDDPKPLVPSIASITPNSGSAGTIVTILGENFATSLGYNTVMFNGVMAAITSATGNKLVVTAPIATSGSVTVTTKGGTTTGPEFTYKNDDSKSLPPSITSLKPSSGPAGTSVTIAGTNFAILPSDNTVRFNGILATVTSATNTEIIVTAPTATTGAVEVSTKNGTITGPDFVYGPDVYVAGRESSGKGNFARYWKNGVVITLTDGTKLACANAITVVGKDVYVAGYEKSDGVNFIAKYWKNGVPVSLTDGSHDAMAFSIAVTGNDIYVVGYESNGTYNVAKYWKNGSPISLTDGTHNADAYAITLVGTDLYIAGDEVNGQYSIAQYWKNDVAVPLTISTTLDYPYSYATAIVVKNNNIYVAGAMVNDVGTYIPVYWRNGTSTVLIDGSTNGGNSYPIAISDDDIYVGGDESNGTAKVATYWKNGSPTTLTNNTGNASVTAITVVDGDVYAAGYELNASGTAFITKYWKNGTAISLTDGTQTSAPYAIFVAQ